MHCTDTHSRGVYRRLDAALEQHQKHGAPILLTGGWTPHRPALIASSGQMLHESTALAQYLLDKGVSATKLYKEWASFDTIGTTHPAKSRERWISALASDVGAEALLLCCSQATGTTRSRRTSIPAAGRMSASSRRTSTWPGRESSSSGSSPWRKRRARRASTTSSA
jgi:hypothetical protein